MRNIRILTLIFSFVSFLTACNTPFKKGMKSVENAQFQKAIGHFGEALQKGGDKATTNLMIAESYRQSNRIKEAEPYYKATLEANPNEENARFHYGYALKANGKYKEAEERFTAYAKSGRNSEFVQRARKEVANLKELAAILKTKYYYVIKNCDGLNTGAAEFAPVVYNNQLLFSSTRKDGTYLGTGGSFAGIYAYNFNDLEECKGAAQVFNEAIFLEGTNEASPTFSPDGTYVIFARSSKGEKGEVDEVDLYISRRTESGWSEPEMMPYPVNNNRSVNPKTKKDVWTSCPNISPDGKRLYFASNRPGGYGGIDLYLGDLGAGGKVTNIRNVGNIVNTKGNELFPFVSNEGVLYFASDGHSGLGGLDIFEAIRSRGKINIKNMGIPINSVADDFAMVFQTDSTGYFSSNRVNGKGDDDIYAFKDITPDKKIVNYFLEITVVTRNPKDTASKETPLPNSLVEFYKGSELKRGEKINDFRADNQGKVAAFPIRVPADFLVVASNGKEYFKQEVEYTTRGKAIPHELLSKPETDTTLLLKVVLDPIIIDKDITYQLEINFNFDKYDIRPDAASELDKFVTFLKDNPQIDIELSSHTDAVGTDAKNQILSQNRANSTTEYLVSKGIDANRITSVGYGERRLKVQTQEAEELNRRTEFRIIRIRK